ncbi:hypothetical protein U5A82_09895 [Sphingobium sp. CR2-8]|uniref:hypothetical protein n=1 Tax=Sphingobium sp. CR2-8 TaxID=1306534 RepID=UPI002DBEBB90|nr:hypothetical protein [Sphingobium sp. CR2-8]MEC3910773.1 hypothetical protein [Sphingobium sp. CR2-8]
MAVMPLPGAAKAQTHHPAVRHAVRCFIVVSSLATNEDATMKMSGLIGSMFFADQIFGAEPDIDLTSLMTREAIDIDESQTRTLLVQCGEELKQRGGQITAAGNALSAMSGKAR